MEKDFLSFIGVGVEKCGTTWLANMLDSHPEVCLSEPKEVHYFNKKDSYIRDEYNPKFNKSEGWYLNHFLHCSESSVKGEFSTFYFFDETAPKKIYENFPDIKIFLCLRNPIDRAVSQYKMYKNKFKLESRPFDVVLKEEPELLEKGLYAEQLKRYLKYFDIENIKVFFLEDIKKNPEIIIKEAYSFINVDNSFMPNELDEKKNVAKATRSKFLFNVMSLYTKLSRQMGLGKLTNFLKKIGIKDFVMKLNSTSFSENVIFDRQALIDYYKSDIKELEKILNKDLSVWLKN